MLQSVKVDVTSTVASCFAPVMAVVSGVAKAITSEVSTHRNDQGRMTKK
jgi:hypothetical protein